MPLSRSEVSPQVPLELGPKCQIISEALLTSIDWMWSKPTELLAPVLGSHTACQVNLTSAVVIGVPSDQLRPGLSLTVTSMCLSSSFLTIPLSAVGTSVTMSGTGLSSGPNRQRSDQMASFAWTVVAALVLMGLRSVTCSQSE